MERKYKTKLESKSWKEAEENLNNMIELIDKYPIRSFNYQSVQSEYKTNYQL